MSDGFDYTIKCMKKPVQRRAKEGRDKCVHRAGEQLAGASQGDACEDCIARKLTFQKKPCEIVRCTGKEKSSCENNSVRK